MSLAPEVYAFNRQLSRGQNPLMQAAEGIGSAIDFAGRAALGTGLLVGAGLLAGKYLKPQETKKPISQPTETVTTPITSVSAPTSTEAGPSVIKERQYPPSSDMPKATKLGTLEHITAQAVETLEGSPGMSPEQASMAELARQSRQFEAGEKLLGSETEISDLDAVLAGISQSFAKTYASKLQLDDEPSVVLSSSQNTPNPASPLSQNTEATDHPSPGEINNPIVNNQTEVTQVLRGTSPTKPTRTPIENKDVTQTAVLATQQNSYPGTESEQLVQGAMQRGTPLPHTPIQDVADAFRKTAQYKEMMRDAGAEMKPEVLIGNPNQPVVFTKVHTTPATRITGAEPVSTESPIAAMASPKVESVAPQTTAEASAPVVVTAPVRRSAESDAKEQMERKYLGLNLRTQASPTTETIVTSQPPTVRVSETAAPTGKAFLASKLGDLPGSISGGLLQYMQEKEMYEGQRNPPKGTIHGSPEGPSAVIEHVRLYPNNTMGIKLKNADVEYVHKVDPGFVPYAAEMIKSGDFYGKDYNKMKEIGVLQPHIGSEDLPRNKAALASFISQERARLGL